MAVKTSTFGPLILSGKDATSFLKQVQNSGPNPLAQASFKRGEKILDEYLENGFAVIMPKK